MNRYDVIVIGAGHNGLVCAAMLAKNGRKVLVLERRDKPGGLCAAEEFHPGFTVPGFFHDTQTLSSQVVRQLDLEKFGLRRQLVIPIKVMQSNEFLFTLDGYGLSGVTDKQQTAFREWRKLVDTLKPLLRALAHRSPPVMHPESSSDYLRLALTGIKLRALGKRRMVELMRITPMCLADWLNEYFPDRKMSEAIAAGSLLGSFQGPWSAGTAFNLLLQESLRDKHVIGGPAALVIALVAACDNAGVSVNLNTTVKQVVIEQNTVKGVLLMNGERIEATTVVAATDPKTLLLDMVESRQLDVCIEKQVRAIRTRGTLAKIHLGIRGEAGFDSHLSRVRLCTGSIDNLEKAFDAVKYGEFSKIPFLDISVPSMETPELAPQGHHVLSVMVGYAPYALRAGWSDNTRTALTETVIERIEQVVPGLRQRIVCQEVLTPVDIEMRYGVHQGQVHHVEPALDQLLGMRPTISTSHYATPIAGLRLCGSGSHPMGGVTGLPGLLAAQAVP